MYNAIALFTNKTIMKILHYVTLLLLIVGWINWGLVGIFELDLVAYLLGEMTLLSKTVYVLVWLSAIYEIFAHRQNCKICDMN